MSLTVPTAGVIAGRAASPQIEADQTGDIVAQFGRTMMGVGNQLAAEQEQRGMGRARVETAQAFNEIQLKYQQEGDPDAIDQGFTADRAALKERILGSVPEGIRPQVSLMIDEMALPHAARLGGRAVELRQSQDLASLAQLGNEVVRAAATGDPATQAAYRKQYDDQLAAAVARGVITPAQAEQSRQGLGGQMEGARAQRLLSENPDALVGAIDAGEFKVMDGDTAQGWRARAVAARDAAAARAAAAAEVERKQQLTSAKAVLTDGTKVLRTGVPYAGADDAVVAMLDPEVAKSPEAREYLATVQLMQEKPQLAVMPLPDKRALLADLQKTPVREDYEADRITALKGMIAADEQGFRDDPLTYATTIGVARSVPALPDPATASPDELAAGLRARSAFVGSLAEARYTDPTKPKFFTPDEREAWGKLVGPDASPAQKAVLAQTFAASLGPKAGAAAREIGADSVFGLVGGGLANGMAPQTAKQVFEGQRIIEGQQVKLPAKADRREAFFGEFSGLFFDGTSPGWGDQSGARDQVTSAADALYAYKMRGKVAAGDGGDGQIDATTYLQSVHEVMGGEGEFDGSDARGGIQELRDQLTILPAGVSADTVDQRLSGLAAAPPAVWSSISVTGAKPQVGGQFPNAESLRRVNLRAVGPDQYLMVWPSSETGQMTVMMGDDGKPFRLSMRALVDGGRRK